jgi:hypothetical protein
MDFGFRAGNLLKRSRMASLLLIPSRVNKPTGDCKKGKPIQPE